MDALEQLGREKVYYDNTVDYHLIIARWTAFWKIYKDYDENKEIKDEIQKKIEEQEEKIKELNEDVRKKINEVVELYLWKEKNYGRHEV